MGSAAGCLASLLSHIKYTLRARQRRSAAFEVDDVRDDANARCEACLKRRPIRWIGGIPEKIHEKWCKKKSGYFLPHGDSVGPAM